MDITESAGVMKKNRKTNLANRDTGMCNPILSTFTLENSVSKEEGDTFNLKGETLVVSVE